MLSSAQLALAHPQSIVDTDIRMSKGSSKGGASHEVGTANLNGMTMCRDRRTSSDPPGSPSSPSTLTPRHPQRIRQPNNFLVTQSHYWSPWERRRFIDGGVRLAGGPPDNFHARQEDAPDDRDDVQSGVSTLQPAYQVYPAAYREWAASQ